MIYDFAVIGSGASGGWLAHELTRMGGTGILLEAGRAFDARSFPGRELEYTARMFWNSGLELDAQGRLGFLRAKCLGGTTVVNQALLDRFDEEALTDWRQLSGVDYLNLADLESDYSTVERGLKIQEIPEKYYNQNAKKFIAAMNQKGLAWRPLRRAESDCGHDLKSDCMVCLGGCPRDSKQSTLVTVIRSAVSSGLRVESEFEVLRIEENGGSVRIQGVQRGSPVEIRAARVALAAGSIGNVQILQRSDWGSRLPALGQGFSCHPQYMCFGLYDEPIDAHKGPFQSVKSQDPGLRQRGFKFENVFAPPAGTAMLVPGWGDSHRSVMKKYRFLTSIEVCVRDEPTGSIRVDSRGKVRIHKPLTAQDRRRREDGFQTIRELMLAAGAKQVIETDQGFGLHLMGGCAIGVDEASSVVGPDFRVHGSKRVFAADSSVFPSAPGINPSLTIMALSVRAAKLMGGSAS